MIMKNGLQFFKLWIYVNPMEGIDMIIWLDSQKKATQGNLIWMSTYMAWWRHYKQ